MILYLTHYTTEDAYYNKTERVRTDETVDGVLEFANSVAFGRLDHIEIKRIYKVNLDYTTVTVVVPYLDGFQVKLKEDK